MCEKVALTRKRYVKRFENTTNENSENLIPNGKNLDESINVDAF